MYSGKLALAIFSHNRPQYLAETLKSIYANTQLGDIYIYQDGPMPHKVKRVLDKYEATKLVQRKNIGIHRQKLLSHELFNLYERVIFFEDDMIVSPYYIKLVCAISNKYPESVIHAGDRMLNLPKSFQGNLDKIRLTSQHFWGYLMPQEVGKVLTRPLRRYCKLAGDDYSKRPHKAIKETFGCMVSSHDSFIDKQLHDMGVQRIGTVVPRAKYIGQEGMHFTAKSFQEKGFGKQKPYIFKEDENLTEFSWI